MANNLEITSDIPIVYRGADISKHNGDINWEKVDKNELNFVIIRAGYGYCTVDTKFKYNIEGAIKAGLDIGIYWFSYAHDTNDAKLEAQCCLQTIEPYRKYINFPVWFDWEYDSDNYVRKRYKCVLDKGEVSAIAKCFLQTVSASGYMVGNYANVDYLTRYFSDDIKNNYDTWLAHVKDGKGNPLLRSSYKGKYTMHQYSWVGIPKGFNSKTDMNFCYYDYKKTQTNEASTEQTKPKSKTTELPDGYFAVPENKNVVTVYSFKNSAKKFVSNHFQVNEFASYRTKNELYTNDVKIHNKLIIMLERIYSKLKCSKIIVTSGYRTPEHDMIVGGNGKGYHTKGRAADIICYDKQGNIIKAEDVCVTLENMGDIYGIGYVDPAVVHVDTRPKSSKWFGDETIGGAPNILKLGYPSFKEYFRFKNKYNI